ncbi:MAG: hypothetical protein GY949_13935 [Gammaproteobacteria bacterium]|nr:hypothetical protein [Gammaproteobacteria bacterium]
MKGLIEGVALVLLSQLIFWACLGFAESKARPDGSPAARTVAMQFADESGRPLPGMEVVKVPLMAEPAYVHRDNDRHPRALFTHAFEYDGNGTELGVMLGWSRRIVDVRLNNVPLKTQTPADIWGILGGYEPVIYSFPSEYLQRSENQLELLTDGRSKKILPFFFIGDLAALYSAHNWGRLFSVDLVLAAIGVMVFVILLCLLIDWPTQDQGRVRALILLLSAWTLRNLTFLGIDGNFPDPLRLLSHFLVTYFFLFAFVVFALGWTRRSRWTYKVASWLFAGCCLVTAIVSFLSEQALFDVGWAIETGVTLVIGVVVTVLFVTYWVADGKSETVEIFLFLVCVAAIVVDAIDDRWQIAVPLATNLHLTFYAAPMCGLLLALGMCASLAAQSTRARVAIMNANEILQEKLREQEVRLNKSHERETEIAREKALAEERERIIRDMHDGVGGNMMSLLLRARRQELSNEELVGELDANMSDLRLIIDSFDHVGDNLEFALATFRQRVAPRMEAANVQLHYATDVAEDISGFGPESVLQIYRVLQEACSNAVIHGAAKNVTIGVATDAAELQIVIEDDGVGLDSSAASNGGRGLANIHKRAAALGGSASIERVSERGGTRVTLRIPMR